MAAATLASRTSAKGARAGRALRLWRWSRVAAHAAAALLILRFVFPRATPARRRTLVRWWSAKLLRILGIERRVEGPRPRRGEPAMIAANHVSWIDIFLVLSARPARFIAKSEIRDWPVAGWIADKSGTLFIRRGRRHDIARINTLVHDAMGDGDCVGLFPEGTTTEGDRLLKFHTSLFEPALANGARIHPCAIRYQHADGSPCPQMAYAGETTFMESFALVIAQKGVTARIAFAPAIEAGVSDRRAVAHLAHERVATLLGLPVPGTPPGKDADPPAAPR